MINSYNPIDSICGYDTLLINNNIYTLIRFGADEVPGLSGASAATEGRSSAGGGVPGGARERLKDLWGCTFLGGST